MRSPFDLVMTEEQAHVIRRAVESLRLVGDLCGGRANDRREISAEDFTGFVALVGGSLEELLGQLQREAADRREEPVRASFGVPMVAWFLDALESGPAALRDEAMVTHLDGMLASHARQMTGYARLQAQWRHVLARHTTEVPAGDDDQPDPLCHGVGEGLLTWLVGAVDRGAAAMADQARVGQLDQVLRAAATDDAQAWAPVLRRWDSLLEAQRRLAPVGGTPSRQAQKPGGAKRRRAVTRGKAGGRAAGLADRAAAGTAHHAS